MEEGGGGRTGHDLMVLALHCSVSNKELDSYPFAVPVVYSPLQYRAAKKHGGPEKSGPPTIPRCQEIPRVL